MDVPCPIVAKTGRIQGGERVEYVIGCLLLEESFAGFRGPEPEKGSRLRGIHFKLFILLL
jgi:hypothetical protein